MADDAQGQRDDGSVTDSPDQQPGATPSKADQDEQERRREFDREQRRSSSARQKTAVASAANEATKQASGLVGNPFVKLGLRIASALGIPGWIANNWKFIFFFKYVLPTILGILVLFGLIFLVVYMYFMIKDTILGVVLPSPS